jgi:methionyl-tRNA formyltransferase
VRLLFAGTPDTALPSLRALIAHPGHDVLGVLTRPDAPSGRGRSVHPSPVAVLAAEHDIPVFKPDRPTEPDFLHAARELDVDACPVVAYGALIREPALSLARIGWVNLHFSLLPAWRGAAPVQHAVLRGDEITGASTFLIGPGLDDGPVYGMVTEPIRARDTSGELLARLADSGAQLLAATMDGLAAGELVPVPQSADGISLAPKLTVTDARIDFEVPATAIDRRIRACTPAPGAWTTFRGERLKLGPVTLAHPAAAVSDPQLEPGRLRVGREAVEVGTATTPIRLSTVQPAGKRPMAAVDWARGMRPGEGEGVG